MNPALRMDIENCALMAPNSWGNRHFEAYEEDKVRRLGPESIEPKRVKYKRFAR
ncbi:MAG: hypothetical protein IOD01_03955 [Rhodobacter sp.]|nr:hypothetical protein [Rhodobacter sp.]